MNVKKMKLVKRGRGFLNKIINNLPIELHIPGYQYCGPGTKLLKRLARGDPGINPLDKVCKEHDIAQSHNKDNLENRHIADRILAEKAWGRVLAKDANIGEKAAVFAIANTMKLKTKLGMGLKKAMRKKRTKGILPLRNISAAKKSVLPNDNTFTAIKSALKSARIAVRKAGGKRKVKKPRVLPVPHKVGGFLPFLVPIFAGLSAIGALSGGAAGIAKAVNDTRAAKKQLEESQRHNKTMEAIALGKGLHLKPYKKTDSDLLKYAKIMKIRHFRGVFMRDELPITGPCKFEVAIVNLDSKNNTGTHWVAYKKTGNEVVYFDSYGNLRPPTYLIKYLSIVNIKYNHTKYQNYDTYICGHLCLKFVCNQLHVKSFFTLYK